MPKLITDANIKILYDDLRERIEDITDDLFTTTEAIQTMMNQYGQEQEDDESMVVEMTFNQQVYTSTTDVSDIVAAFKLGKNIVFHFPPEEQSAPDAYCVLIAIEDEYIDGSNNTCDPVFSLISVGSNGIVLTGLMGQQIINNKLVIPSRADDTEE